METNAANLQEYVNTLGAEPWYEKVGMLGLGLFGSFVVSVILFLVVLYAIGVVKKYREKKEWLIPNKEYWMEIGRAGSSWMKTWVGIPTPRGLVDRADKVYMVLTSAQFQYGLRRADVVMEQIKAVWPEGIIKRAFDCENSARLRAQLAVFFIAQEYGVEGFGVPIGTIGYLRNGEDAHEDVQAILDNNWTLPVLASAYAGCVNPYFSDLERGTIYFDVI